MLNPWNNSIITIFNNLIYLILLYLIFLFLFKMVLKENRILSQTICIFLSLHVILVAFILIEQHRFKINLANSFNMDDGEAYSANAWQISTALTGNIPDLSSVAQMRGIHLTDRGWGLEKFYNNYIKKKIIAPADEYEVGYITYLYAIIYAAYEFKPVLINFMNVIFHIFTAILIYKSVKYIFNHKTAYLSTLFFLLNPTSFYYSSTKLQESIFIFTVYFSIYCYTLTIKKKSFGHAFFILPSLFIIYTLIKKLYFFPLLIVFILSSAVIIFKKSKKIFFVSFLLIFFVLYCKHVEIFKEIKAFAVDRLTVSVIYQKGFHSTGGQIYRLFIPGKESHDYTLVDWVNYTCKGWYHMLFEPILTPNTSLKLLLFYPVKIIFLILCVFAILGTLMAIRYGYTEAVIFISMFIVVGSGIALSSGNIGTLLRHRDIVTPIIFIFSSFYMSRFYNVLDHGGRRKR